MAKRGLISTIQTDRSGASAAEYALILAILGGSIAIGSLLLGQSIAGAVDDSAALIASYTGPGSAGPTTTGSAPGTGGSAASSPPQTHGNSANAPGHDPAGPGQSENTPATGAPPPGSVNNPGQGKGKTK